MEIAFPKSPMSGTNAKDVSETRRFSHQQIIKIYVVLVRVSIVVKRHHDQGNSYKGKHLVGAGLQFQRFRPLSSWWEAWQHAGRHGARGAEGSEEETVV